MSREENEDQIALVRTKVANLASEFQVLNQAAQVKFNSYMEPDGGGDRTQGCGEDGIG